VYWLDYFNQGARYKSCIVNRQIGVREFKYVGKICPLRTCNVILRMRSGCKRIVDGILWGMPELITRERIAVESSNLADGWSTRPAMYDH